MGSPLLFCVSTHIAVMTSISKHMSAAPSKMRKALGQFFSTRLAPRIIAIIHKPRINSVRSTIISLLQLQGGIELPNERYSNILQILSYVKRGGE